MAKKLFSSQNDDEKIIVVANRHSFTFFRDALGSIFLFIVSLIVMVTFFYVPYVLVASFIVFLFSIIGGLYSYFTWERDKYIITDLRVVDMDQSTLFTKSQKEAFLDKIQDVTTEIRGVFGTVFKYGNVTIQTAGEVSLTLNDIANPEKVQKTILNMVREKEAKGNSDSNLMQKMTEMIRSALKQDTEKKV